MGPSLLIACLWGVVLVYWLWSRRPAMRDPVGSFRYELRVLGSATPARVPPANRRCPTEPAVPRAAPYEAAAKPHPLAVAARSHSRQELRRRRRDVIAVLAATALLSLFGAFLTGSPFVIFLQVMADMALVAYIYLLGRATGALARAGQVSLGARAGLQVAMPAADFGESGYRRARALRGGGWQEASYGDFGSYASLAVMRGH